jgi:hypothetical protein
MTTTTLTDPTSPDLAAARQSVNAQLEVLASRVARLADPVEQLATGDTGDKAVGHVGLAVVGELAGITASLLLLRRDVEALEGLAWRVGRAAGRHPAAQPVHVRVMR